MRIRAATAPSSARSSVGRPPAGSPGARWADSEPTPGWGLPALLLLALALALAAGCDEGGCRHDVDCPGTQVCRDGSCLWPACGGGCQAGFYCDGARCMPCDSDRHCGPDCVDCSLRDENRACVDGACGCTSQADCREQQLCYQQRCTWCVPDCSERCCGNDGCGGRCPDRCAELGLVCNTDSCRCEQPCQPADCAGLGKQCGRWEDGCGGSLDCGGCSGQARCDHAGRCIGPSGPHSGAGQACHCAGADCALPCPEGDGAASLCLVTNEPEPDDGYCSFACSGPGRDAECWVDFADGCCMAFGERYYCVDASRCPAERGYLQTCGQEVGGCGGGLLCVNTAEADPARCLWACEPDAGDCADGGRCVGLEGGGGACLPPGELPAEALCQIPLFNCAADLGCVRIDPARMGYCAQSCDCAGGAGCSAPAECMWTVSQGLEQTCYCGRACPSQDAAVDCPNAWEWTCQDLSSGGDPLWTCVPAISASP